MAMKKLAAILLAAALCLDAGRCALHAQALGEPLDEAEAAPAAPRRPGPPGRRPRAADDADAGQGPRPSRPGETFVIAAGDVVSITVYPVEEYSREVTVQPDGNIELPLLGSLLIKGLSSRELQDLLQQRYAKFVSNPQVTVAVRRFAGRRLAIIGDIRSPGYYEYRDGMRLLELVAQAGGVNETARASRVTILRPNRDGSGGESLVVNFRAVLDGDLARNPAVAPGDIIHVPKAGLTRGAEWTTRNILPWVSIMTLIVSLVIVTTQRK